MDGVANGDHIACPTNIQVGSSKSDETRIGYSMQVPKRQKSQWLNHILNINLQIYQSLGFFFIQSHLRCVYGYI